MPNAENIAIRVEGLGKKFQLGQIQSYKTLRDSFVHAVAAHVEGAKRMLSGQGRAKAPHSNDLWALKNVSFEIPHGEAVGIIGGNGAGKSTLLKILARITNPTEGTGVVRGRVGSLLEVGTGFHPELTGRENIYLNGAILGMPWTDIRKRFDDIVAFAEVERFVDTPVKHYSSGMYMRLAFSVAAHLEPDVLLVDEVLAVGDVAYQKKCLGRMNEVAGSGRTVLFVSHNMAQMQRLCSRVIWLSRGGLVADGPAEQVIAKYLQSCAEVGMAVQNYTPDNAPGDESVRLQSVRICSPSGEAQSVFNMDEPIRVACDCRVLKPTENLHLLVYVYTNDGVLVFGSASWDHFGLEPPRMLQPGSYRYEMAIPPHLLNRGQFVVSLNAQIPGVRFVFKIDRGVAFEVTEIGGAGGAKSSDRAGLVRPLLPWHIAPLP